MDRSHPRRRFGTDVSHCFDLRWSCDTDIDRTEVTYPHTCGECGTERASFTRAKCQWCVASFFVGHVNKQLDAPSEWATDEYWDSAWISHTERFREPLLRDTIEEDDGGEVA